MRPKLRMLGGAAASLIAVIGLGYVFDLRQVGATLLASNLGWVASAMAVCLALGITFSAIRLQTIMAVDAETELPTLWDFTKIQINSTAINNLSISLAGEAARIFALRNRGFSINSCVGAQLFEKIIELTGLGTICAALLLSHALPGPVSVFVRVIAAFTVAVVLATLLVQRIGAGAVDPDPADKWTWRSAVHRFVLQLSRYGTARTWLGALGFSLLAEASNTVTAFCAIMATGILPDPIACFLVVLFVRASALVPAAPAHVGVQEVGASTALLACGIAPDKALAAAILLHLANFLPAVAGAACLQWLRPKSSLSQPL